MKTQSALKHMEGLEWKSHMGRSQVLRHRWCLLRLFCKNQKGGRGLKVLAKSLGTVTVFVFVPVPVCSCIPLTQSPMA